MSARPDTSRRTASGFALRDQIRSAVGGVVGFRAILVPRKGEKYSTPLGFTIAPCVSARFETCREPRARSSQGSAMAAPAAPWPSGRILGSKPRDDSSRPMKPRSYRADHHQVDPERGGVQRSGQRGGC